MIGDNPTDRLFGTQTTFDDILCKASSLMHSEAVRSFVATTYPVILIDEFQDCHGLVLTFVQAMVACSSLLLAGDEFQLLETDVSGCPAIEWARRLESEGKAEMVELPSCRRTAVRPILAATTALRNDVPVTEESIPIFLCPGAGLAAFRIISSLVYGRPTRCTGTCALLTPTHDPWLGEVLSSCDKQLLKKGLSSMSWHVEVAEPAAEHEILAALQVDDASAHADVWLAPPASAQPAVRHAVECVQRFAHARGLSSISRGAVAYLAKRLVHVERTRSHHSAKRVISTIHGAKNREFDHVFILWPYKVPSDRESKSRLLYNAISRARSSVMLLVRGDQKRFDEDSVLPLLGLARPAIPPKRKTPPKRSRASRG
ncbi:MAG: ATP-binding domain-containing protein [Candidatus Aminicenantes bacterium]|nr:ATP-binding domain-containing protein [Candidatus Aminicenantes bacterium]